VARKLLNVQRDERVEAARRNLVDATDSARKDGEGIGRLLRTELAPSARLSIAAVDHVADGYPRAETGPSAGLAYAALAEIGEATLLHVRKLQALRPRLPRAARVLIDADLIDEFAGQLAAVADDWSAEIGDPVSMVRVLAGINMRLLMSGMGCANLRWQPRCRDLESARLSLKAEYIEWAGRLNATEEGELEHLGDQAEKLAGPRKKAADERIKQAEAEYQRAVDRRMWRKSAD
jgi:hypothetical protein